MKKFKKLSTQKIVVAGLLGAVCIVLGSTGLGMIPMPTPTGRATIMHIPVIIAAILEGPVVGAMTGLIFGIYSFLTPVGLIPADPIVRILPRIAIGLVAGWSFQACRGKLIWRSALAGILGTITNTAGFLGLAVLLGYLPKQAVVLMLPQAAAELVVATVIVVFLAKVLKNRIH